VSPCNKQATDRMASLLFHTVFITKNKDTTTGVDFTERAATWPEIGDPAVL
jgi:hypothetical protein